VKPSRPNAYKLERFVFDALPAAERACIVETDRVREYSPVKNAGGPDSPETARRALMALYRAWLAGAGIEPPAGGVDLEIDQSVVDGPEDLTGLGITRIEEAPQVIRTARGGGM
jgi:hypothetical protein